jgi:hypothetical protein
MKHRHRTNSSIIAIVASSALIATEVGRPDTFKLNGD